MDLLLEGFTEAIALILGRDTELLEIGIRSLLVSGVATLVAAVVGIPLAVLLRVRRFRMKPLLITLINSGMGLPPVLVGLIVSILLWRTGVFGALQLIYTPTAMIIAQVVVALPLAAGFSYSALKALDAELLEALRIDGAGDAIAGRELIHAALPQILLAITAAFGRAIAEVGASLMVGGNIAGQTRVLTTAIALETNRGEFALAIALGLILLLLAFAVNAVTRVVSAG